MPNGWSELGQALFGGGLAEQRGFDRGLSIQGKLLKARKAQHEEASRMGLRDAAVAAGMDPVKADLLSMTFGAGYNPEQLSGFQLDQQRLGFNTDNMAAARDASVPMGELNRMLMATDGKPVQVQRSMGQGVYTPNAYDPASVPQTNELGEALIGAAEALAGQREATGQAALIRANRAPSKPQSTAASEASVLADARAAIAAGASVEAVKERLSQNGYTKLAGRL